MTFMELLEQMPWYGDLLVGMGFLRVIFKPIFTILNAIVEATPTDRDDQFMADFRQTNTFKMVVLGLDFFASIKIK